MAACSAEHTTKALVAIAETYADECRVYLQYAFIGAAHINVGL
jgi:hypothetical protein